MAFAGLAVFPSPRVTKITRSDVCAFCMTASEFYNSRAWAMKRQAILRRDGYMCRECKRYGRMREAVTVHHIQHLEDRPDLALADENLVSLCMACHNKAHPEKAAERNRQLARRYPPRGQDLD